MTVLPRTLLFALAGVMLLSACARTSSPSLYLLDFPVGPELAGIEHGVAVGVGPIDLPQYLDRPQIITRTSVNQVSAAEGHQWAEPLKNSVSRVIVVQIARRLDSNRIYLLPRRISTALDYRVEIDIGRLDGSIGGDMVLAARWSLLRGESKTPLMTRVSLLHEPVTADDYEALVSAQVRVLERMSDEIADAIRAGGD